jgi:hypothetical protein
LPIAINEDIAGRLDEVARILAEQGANRFRVQAYQQAALVLRGLARPVSEIFAEEGLAGLEKLPGVGESIARSIRDILLHGKLAMLERFRGVHDPRALQTSVPGIGKALPIVAFLRLVKLRSMHSVSMTPSATGLEPAAKLDVQTTNVPEHFLVAIHAGKRQEPVERTSSEPNTKTTGRLEEILKHAPRYRAWGINE